MVSKIIDGKDGNPKIIMDKVSFAPKVVPIKFDSTEFAQHFVRHHGAKNAQFPHRYDGFWCNISQSLEERQILNRNIRALYKKNRSICEVIHIHDNQILLSKVNKHILFAEGIELRFIWSLMSSGSMTWDRTIMSGVKDRYEGLTRDI